MIASVRRFYPVLALVVLATPAQAIEPVASFRYLVTGNGFGFQVFDASANAVNQYLERPYRFIRANPSNPDGEGIVRRNLAFDTYFGVKVGGTAAWLGGRAPTEVGYVAETNMIRSAVAIGGVTTETFFVSPFGYEGNALVMLLRVTNTSGSSLFAWFASSRCRTARRAAISSTNTRWASHCLALRTAILRKLGY